MKTIIALILSLAAADIYAQHHLPVLYYLNDDEIDKENVYINDANIDEISVDKSKETDAIYIKTKQPLTFLTLDMILKDEGLSDSIGLMIYMINDKLVAEKSKVKVDATYFIQVKVKPLDKLSYIDEVHKSLVLVDIDLFKEKPPIRIRGDKGD